MTDSRIRSLSGPVSVDALVTLVAEPVRGRLGPSDIEINCVAPLPDGVKGALVFCRKTGDAGAALVVESAASVIVADANTPRVRWSKRARGLAPVAISARVPSLGPT